VLRLDASSREVVVGPREALRIRSIKLRDVNWLGDEPFESFASSGEEILARIRSSGPLQPARLSLDDDGVVVDLAQGEDGVSPGQACVFYAADGGGERLLGGGWIKSASRRAILAKDGFAVPADNRRAEKTLAAVAR
jgi:tRNA-specific 2-thiouridylase